MIASGFPLSDGQVNVTVPENTTPGMYSIVCKCPGTIIAQLRKLTVDSVIGDSGNFGDDFPIDADTS